MTALEMNPEIRARWVAALRSGDYPQTTRRLHTEDGFCCLGVLCDLAEKDGVIRSENFDGVWEYGDSNSLLPPQVLYWAGLREACPVVEAEVDHDRAMWELTGLNDEDHWDFGQIADAIEGKP